MVGTAVDDVSRQVKKHIGSKELVVTANARISGWGVPPLSKAK
jgi:hypothetical protein